MSDGFVHPMAIVESAEIGPGTRVWAYSHVMRGATIGANCNIGEHSFIEAGAAIGDNVTVKNGNLIWEGVTIEDGVFVGPNVLFTNDLYPRSPRLPQAQRRYRDHGWLTPTRVRRGASIGAGAVIVAGVAIGEFAMVGAGAVVTQDIPAHALVVGNPARVRGWVCECGQPLEWQGEQARCRECAREFERDGEAMRAARPMAW